MNLQQSPHLPSVTTVAAERAVWERDGLPPAWADMERRYIDICHSCRVGCGHMPMPRALAARAVNRTRRPIRGVAWHKPSGKWWAYRPLSEKRRKSLGYFPSKVEAEKAVQADKDRLAKYAPITS